MSDEKSIEQKAAEEHQNQQHQIELGSKQVENAKALNHVDEAVQKDKDRKLQGRDLINQLVGRTQMANALSQFSNLATTTYLIKVKENQLYKDLKGCVLYDKEGNEITNVSTWDGFCDAIGISRSKADRDIADYKAFGGETVDAMEIAGISYRQRSKLKQLPDDDLATVITEVENNIGNQQAIVELVETTIIKHAKEKEKLTEEKQDLQQQIQAAQDKVDATQRILEVKGKKIHELEKVVDKCLTPDEQRKHQLDQEQTLKNQLEQVEAECALAIDRLDLVIGQIYEHPKCSDELVQMPSKLYEYLLKHLVNVADQYQIQFDANQILSPILYNLMDNDAQSDGG